MFYIIFNNNQYANFYTQTTPIHIYFTTWQIDRMADLYRLQLRLPYTTSETKTWGGKEQHKQTDLYHFILKISVEWVAF